jgi:ethanolamine ammonia-lyase large subunit
MNIFADNPVCDSYTEKDSLEAAKKLETKIVTSDRFFIEREDCIFAHVNTTIVSLCSGVETAHMQEDLQG